MKKRFVVAAVVVIVAAGGYLGTQMFPHARLVERATALLGHVRSSSSAPTTSISKAVARGSSSASGAAAAPAAIPSPRMSTPAEGAGGLLTGASAMPSAALETPAILTDVNVASMKVGGEIERMTGVYAAGYIGHHLIDGLAAPTWKLSSPVTYPQEIVFSFFEREPVLVGALTIVLPADASLAPRDVEIQTSMDSPTSGFVHVAEQRLDAKPGEQTITFPAVNARFLQLRILSGASPAGLEIAEVRALEATRGGYVALFTRQPRAAWWADSARAAAQRGLDWLEQSAPDWQKDHQCFGCHVQSEVLMGQRIAIEQHYRVNLDSFHALDAGSANTRNPTAHGSAIRRRRRSTACWDSPTTTLRPMRPPTTSSSRDSIG